MKQEQVLVAAEEYLWCRNCGEMVTHELIEMRLCPKEDSLVNRLRSKLCERKPIYACMICRCQRAK